jgi:hypothetical protein
MAGKPEWVTGEPGGDPTSPAIAAPTTKTRTFHPLIRSGRFGGRGRPQRNDPDRHGRKGTPVQMPRSTALREAGAAARLKVWVGPGIRRKRKKDTRPRGRNSIKGKDGPRGNAPIATYRARGNAFKTTGAAYTPTGFYSGGSLYSASSTQPSRTQSAATLSGTSATSSGR